MPCFQPNVGYLEANVTDFMPNGAFLADPMACQAECQAQAFCQHFTFREAASAPNILPALSPGACWLLGAEAKPQVKAGLVSGPKVCPAGDAAPKEAPASVPMPAPAPAPAAATTLAPVPGAPSPSEASVPTEQQATPLLMGGLPWLWLVLAALAACGLTQLIMHLLCSRRSSKGVASRHKRRAKERMERAVDLDDQAAMPGKESDPLLFPEKPMVQYPQSFPGVAPMAQQAPQNPVMSQQWMGQQQMLRQQQAMMQQQQQQQLQYGAYQVPPGAPRYPMAP